jgi:hypothetical protein
MRIIEALKKKKANLARMTSILGLVKINSAALSSTVSGYKDPVAQLQSWVDEYNSLVNENEELLHRVHETNLSTLVTITIGGNTITQSIDRWIYRRQAGIDAQSALYAGMTDCGLRASLVPQPTGEAIHVTVVRFFDPELRDRKLSELQSEPYAIDSALEIINATTDLVG